MRIIEGDTNMYFRHFFDENLAHSSYLVGCQRTGEAIVIDPARLLEPYFEAAKKENLDIVAATETHIHADYLSGARELADLHDAKLYLSDEGDENWKYTFADDVSSELLTDGDVFHVGNVSFKVMHTPGHTPESISFVLTDHGSGADEPMGIFTGDFMFVGDVGRPDLLEKAAGIEGTADSGAKAMYKSIQKFKELPEFLQVWPAHGAGSACGKSLGAVPMSTVGYEKKTNWALKDMEEQTFVNTLLEGQPEAPKYFKMMKHLNKVGPENRNLEVVPMLTNVSDLEQYRDKTVLLDTRDSKSFSEKHVKHAINIPYNASFTNWAGWIIDYDEDIVLISQPKDVEAIRIALASIGLDAVVATIEPEKTLTDDAQVERYAQMDVTKLKEVLEDDAYYVIDVRNQSEVDAGKIAGTSHMMLGTVQDRLDELPKDKKYVLHCRSGARSSIAASVLQANGYKDVTNVEGGYLAWLREKYPVEK